MTPIKKPITLVIVKHENNGTAYLFEVPFGNYLQAGNLVLVDTKHGLNVATCMSCSFTMDIESAEYKKVLRSMGATEPLSKVVGVYHLEKFNRD